MDKHFILLQMYDTLLNGGTLELNSCCKRYGYSVATFYRHIAFLRRYFKEECKREVLFDSSEREYVLAKNKICKA